MSKYNTFLVAFIISVAAFIFFMTFYLNSIFAFILHAHEYEEGNAVQVLSTIFNPSIIISGIILAVTSLVYRVLGIVYVARNRTVTDGEKALWIIGFIIMGFITAIVFLVMAKGRKFAE